MGECSERGMNSEFKIEETHFAEPVPMEQDQDSLDNESFV